MAIHPFIPELKNRIAWEEGTREFRELGPFDDDPFWCATWEIKDGKLYLIDVKGQVVTRRPDPMWSSTERFDDPNLTKLERTTLLREFRAHHRDDDRTFFYRKLDPDPIFADWFSGQLLVGKGYRLFNGAIFVEPYETELYISITAGQVDNIVTVKVREIRAAALDRLKGICSDIKNEFDRKEPNLTERTSFKWRKFKNPFHPSTDPNDISLYERCKKAINDDHPQIIKQLRGLQLGTAIGSVLHGSYEELLITERSGLLINKLRSVYGFGEETIMRELGTDPKSGKLVLGAVGRFFPRDSVGVVRLGPLVMIGSPHGEDSLTFAGLRPGQSLETITLEEALELFKLPRELGLTPEGEKVFAASGRFGPYIRYDSKFVSLKDFDPLEVTLEHALELIAEKKEFDANRVIRVFEGTDIEVLRGRYSPYITDGNKNARIPKDREPESLTQAECEELIAAAPDRLRGRKKTESKAPISGDEHKPASNDE